MVRWAEGLDWQELTTCYDTARFRIATQCGAVLQWVTKRLRAALRICLKRQLQLRCSGRSVRIRYSSEMKRVPMGASEGIDTHSSRGMHSRREARLWSRCIVPPGESLTCPLGNGRNPKRTVVKRVGRELSRGPRACVAEWCGIEHLVALIWAQPWSARHPPHRDKRNLQGRGCLLDKASPGGQLSSSPATFSLIEPNSTPPDAVH